MALPFRPGVFDVVLLIHVIHLVDDHLETLAEVRRVLRPNGRVIISANEYTEQERRDAEGGRMPTGARLVTSRWNAILTELGLDRRRRPQGQWISDEVLTADLERLGASVERVVLARYQDRARTAREVAAAHRDRIFSSDWPIPDDIHAEASRRLDRWLETEHRAPDELFVDQSAVVVLIGTFAGRTGDRRSLTPAGCPPPDYRPTMPPVLRWNSHGGAAPLRSPPDLLCRGVRDWADPLCRIHPHRAPDRRGDHRHARRHRGAPLLRHDGKLEARQGDR